MSQMKRMQQEAVEAEVARLENKVLDAANKLMKHMGCDAFKLPGRVNPDIVMCVGTADQVRGLLPACDEALALRAHAALGSWVEQAYDRAKTSSCEQLLQALGLPCDGADMPLSWHINRYKEWQDAQG